MDKESEALIGVGSSVLVSAAWNLYPNREAFKLPLFKLSSFTGEPEKSPLAFLEHYHYGLASLISARTFKKYSAYLDGFGLGMILSEFFQNNPFGLGKTLYELTGNLSLTIGLLAVLLYLVD